MESRGLLCFPPGGLHKLLRNKNFTISQSIDSVRWCIFREDAIRCWQQRKTACQNLKQEILCITLYTTMHNIRVHAYYHIKTFLGKTSTFVHGVRVRNNCMLHTSKWLFMHLKVKIWRITQELIKYIKYLLVVFFLA